MTGQRRHHGGEDRRIDDRGRHRARLVDAEDDLVEIGRSGSAARSRPAAPVRWFGARPASAGDWRMVRGQSMSARRGRRVRLPRLSAPRIVSAVRCASRFISSSTTLLTTSRAVSLVFSGIAERRLIRSATRCTSASSVARNSGSSSMALRFSRSKASFWITCTTGPERTRGCRRASARRAAPSRRARPSCDFARCPRRCVIEGADSARSMRRSRSESPSSSSPPSASRQRRALARSDRRSRSASLTALRSPDIFSSNGSAARSPGCIGRGGSGSRRPLAACGPWRSAAQQPPPALDGTEARRTPGAASAAPR